MVFWRFIDTSELWLVSGQYDYDLVIASWLIASLAALSALCLPVHGSGIRGGLKAAWIGLGCLSLGIGVWAMHFIGVAAYEIPARFSYSLLITGLSLVPVFAGMAFTLHILTIKISIVRQLLFGALLVSVSMTCMHYISMEAMNLGAVELGYDLGSLAMSLVLAYFLGLAAVTVFYLASFGDLVAKLGGAGLIGAAFSGLHYVEMLVVDFYSPGPSISFSGKTPADEMMVVGVLFVCLTIVAFVFVISLLEQKLVRLSSSQDLVTNVLPDGIIRLDKDLKVVFSNPAARTLFNYTEEGLHKLYISQLIPSWSWELFDTGRGKGVFTAVARKRLGSEFMLEARLAYQTVHGQQQQLLVVRDVSEMQGFDVHLTRLTNALDQATDAILIISSEKEIVFLNEAMSAQLQDSDENTEIPQFLDQHLDEANAFENSKAWLGYDELRNEDGSFKYLSISISPIRNDRGEITEYLVICRDIGEMKEAQAALVDAKEKAEHEIQDKRDYLSVVSHEIRTPINSIMGLSALLTRTKIDAEQQTTLKLIKQSGENLLNIINNIVDYSKVEAGKLVIEEAQICLKDLLQDIVEVFRQRTTQQRLRLDLNFEDEMPAAVYGDAGRIKQIVSNLLDNAFKFTKEGYVTLNVNRQHSFVPNLAVFRISVIDNGIGIEASAKDRIFEPFTQADSSTARRYGGTGLGLPICKELVELMGGKIGASSVAGQGSVFWFELPLVLVRDSTKLKDPASIIVENYQGIGVLLVEDNPVNRKVVSHMLKKFGCNVELANDGREGLEKSRLSRYDVILMDCNMPGMDGFEATRAIRAEADNPNRSSPVIAITARAMKGDRESCLAAGMTDYITKPVRAVELTSVLNQWTRLNGRDIPAGTALRSEK